MTGAKYAARVMALFDGDRHRTMHISGVASALGIHRETARFALGYLERTCKLERLGKVGAGGTVMYALASASTVASAAALMREVPRHPDAVWTCTLERRGAVDGLSTYQQRVGAL